MPSASRSCTPRSPASPIPSSWRSCARTSSGCCARCTPRSGTGSRCAARAGADRRARGRTHPRSTPSELEETKRFLPGWPMITSRSSATASTSSRDRRLRYDRGSGLGDSSAGTLRGRREHTRLAGKALALLAIRHLLVLTKANSRATVHRPSYLDYVGVKTFDAGGEVTGERRFLGLYTTAAYKESAREIPLLRAQGRRRPARAGFPPDSHDAKALVEILESYPRDSLFQIGVDDLFDDRDRASLRWASDSACGCSCVGTRWTIRGVPRLHSRAIASTPRTASASRGSWRRSSTEPCRLDVAALGVAARARRLHRSHPGGVPDGYDVAEIERRLVQVDPRVGGRAARRAVDATARIMAAGSTSATSARSPPAFRDDWRPGRR